MYEIEQFLRQLAITQQYCERQVQSAENEPAKVLRSFNPVIAGEPLWRFDSVLSNTGKIMYYTTVWSIDSFDGNFVQVGDLFDMQISHKMQSAHNTTLSVATGNILICDFETSIIDGASEAASLGLIDVYDLPPIDTWFYLAKIQAHKGNCYIVGYHLLT